MINIEYKECVAEILRGIDQSQRGHSLALKNLLIIKNHMSDKEIDDIYDLLYKSHRDTQKALAYIIGIIKDQIIPTHSIAVRSKTQNQNWQDANIKTTQQAKKYDDLPEYHCPDVFKKFCEDYNNAIDIPTQKSKFIQYYNPIRFGTTNAMDRRKDPKILPIFQTANSGDYYAIKIDRNPFYLIVPRFDIDFQDYHYHPGAMGVVFECPNYDYVYIYRKVKVSYPALFEPDHAHNQWKFKQNGKLILGAGEL